MPELAANQSGEDELMPFEVLDACLHLYGAEKLAPDEVARALVSIFPERDPAELTAWADKFTRLFNRSIFNPLAMKAMLFAAGLGTRLRPLTNDRPKALVEVNGATLLEVAIRRFIAAGCEELIVNVHHFAEQIIDFI